MLSKRVKSFGYAIAGIKHVFRTQANMKIHVAVAIAVLICGFVFSISITEWLVCLLCFGLVLTAEILNTAIEHVVDLASPNKHPLAKHAKDAAAGAVLVAAVFAAIAGLLIFVPKGWALLFA